MKTRAIFALPTRAYGGRTLQDCPGVTLLGSPPSMAEHRLGDLGAGHAFCRNRAFRVPTGRCDRAPLRSFAAICVNPCEHGPCRYPTSPLPRVLRQHIGEDDGDRSWRQQTCAQTLTGEYSEASPESGLGHQQLSTRPLPRIRSGLAIRRSTETVESRQIRQNHVSAIRGYCDPRAS